MKGARACIVIENSLLCPEEEEENLSDEFPGPKLPDNALHPELKIGVCFEIENVENNNSKWGWIKSGEGSAGRAKYGLSIFW